MNSIVTRRESIFILHLRLFFQILTKIFWSPTWLCNFSTLKTGQVEIPQDHFGVIILIVIHEVFQLGE